MLRRALVQTAGSSIARPAVPPSSCLFRSRIATQTRTAPSPINLRAVQSGVRFYSAEAETKEPLKAEEAKKAEEGKEEAKKEDGEVVELRKKLEEKEKEVIQLKDKYLRQLAEFKDFQTRSDRAQKNARELAIEKFAADLTDSVDNLDRALAGVPNDKISSASQTPAHERPEHLHDLVNLYEGLKLTETILMQTLKKHGVERFDPLGEKLDAKEHSVSVLVPTHVAGDGAKDGHVVGVEKKGFRLHGRLLRAAQVQVAKDAK